MKNRVADLLLIFSLLLAGTFIYFITRTESTIINFSLGEVDNGHWLAFFQGLLSNAALPSWFVYSLPDALWMMAMAVSILLIWNYQFHARSMISYILAICAGMSHELLQGAGVLSGTYDSIDLIFILTAGIIPVLIIYMKNHPIQLPTFNTR